MIMQNPCLNYVHNDFFNDIMDYYNHELHINKTIIADIMWTIYNIQPFAIHLDYLSMIKSTINPLILQDGAPQIQVGL